MRGHLQSLCWQCMQKKCPKRCYKVKGWHGPERVGMGNKLNYWQWPIQVFSVESILALLSCMHASSQKARLIYILQCNANSLLVSTFTFPNQNDADWDFQTATQKLLWEAFFIVLLCHWFIFYFLDLSFHSTLLLQYIPLWQTHSKCTHFRSTPYPVPLVLAGCYGLAQGTSDRDRHSGCIKSMTLKSHSGGPDYHATLLPKGTS